MSPHEITLRDGTTVYGLIGFIDHYEQKFYLLDEHTIGMIGTKGVGKEYSFDECKSVYALMLRSDGRLVRASDEQISVWRIWAKKNLNGLPL